ncbi:hypothetical protein JZ751_025189 [Albula glossodonta]|uniref:A-kinase anchor protein 2 C-terminal domain-containing protein n=1 Tax=Albula glossodonta TaxID=121402 RepID=A0A8T2NE22_9TELE|nr:hypothetical protein JZ751_025189 [Albula glossodonta]
MEPNNNLVTMKTEAVTSPQSSVSQEDCCSGLWMDDSDSVEDKESGKANTPPLTGEAPGAEQKSTWADVSHSDWPSEEPPQLISAETLDNSDGEVEVFHCSSPCAEPTWLAAGKGGRHVPEGEVSTSVTAISLAKEDQDPFDIQEAGPTGQLESSPVAGEKMGSSEDHRVDHNPLDFNLAREQWVRLDSTSSRPPQPSFSRSSSRDQITDPSPVTGPQSSQSQQQEGGPPHHDTIAQDRQQGELLLHRLCLIQQKQEVQQVFEGSPPLDTVTPEPTNQRPSCHGSGSVVVREYIGGRREGEGEERALRETGGEGQQSVIGLHTVKEGKEEQTERGAESTQRGKLKENQGREGQSSPTVHPREGRDNRMEVAYFEDTQSDSGVSADFSPGSTMDLNTMPLDPDDPLPPPPSPPNETPIEREIRRAVEREQSLRRSRGLSKKQEFVEIPLRKPILSQTLPSKSGKGEGTDRQFAGKKMQREISVEAQREEVLVQMGKVPGFYDKGTVRQLQEKKELFEAFQEKRETPMTPVSYSKRASSSASDISALGVREDDRPAVPLLERGRSLDLVTQKQSHNPGATGCKEGFSNNPPVPCGPTLSEGASGQIIILENNMVLRPPAPNPEKPLRQYHSTGSLSEGHRVTVVDSGTMFPSSGPTVEVRGVTVEAKGREDEQDENDDEGEEVDTIKENPFFKLRSSMSLKPKVEQDIREARQRERELRRQRNSLYGATGNGGGQPPSQGTSSPASGATQNGLSTTELPSCNASSTPSARQSLGKLDLTWPPAQTSIEMAGQTEVPRSRQKNPLLQRWESGMVNGHQEDED